jgi:sensor histidine kinase YesM
MLWLGIWAVWTLLALMSASQTALVLSLRGLPIDWGQLLLGRLADWYSCAIFTPLFFWLARRYPLERGGWKKSLAIHVPVSLAAVVVKYAIYVPLMRAISHRQAAMSQVLAGNIFIETMFVWATIAGVHAIEFYRRYRERESAAHRLSAELSRAQLEALRAQLHPHFLFNTLNAIATLIHSDPDGADAMVSKLADLLRGALQYASGTDCTLADELALARTYVDIMQRRFAERVSVQWDIEPALGPARVPAFLLQPLLENAFEHGAAKSNGATTHVAVRAQRAGGALCVSVSDDGPGVADSSNANGIGLSNTRQRLAALYGAAASLAIGPASGGGTTVTATIPYAI